MCVCVQGKEVGPNSKKQKYLSSSDTTYEVQKNQEFEKKKQYLDILLRKFQNYD